jgi:DNA polymerase I
MWGSPVTIDGVAPLLVIDGDSLGHRSYHAMPAVEGAGGRPVGLLVGFANVLLATWRATAPRAVLVCLDARMPSYRHDLLPGYQGQRDPFADDLCEQLDRLPALTEAFGFAAAKVPPYEADDLLATAVTQEEARGGGALVVSGDRDMYQLVSDVTTVLHPRPRGVLEPVDRAGVRERYGIEPEQVTALIALRGDPSDNIPGARGIGQKTAADLLRRYGDLESVIAHAHELTPRQRLAVAEGADDLRRYLDVAAMRRDAPLDVPDDATLQPERAAAWCREAGMLGLAARLTS